MIKGYIFDYGGTLDTRGCHWGKMIWHAYERQHVDVSEDDFREAYVYAERTLGSNPIIQPSDTFHKTLDVKLRLEMEYLEEHAHGGASKDWKAAHEQVLNDLYRQVKAITGESRDVLLRLHEQYPMVLVSNFYGNVSTVLREFRLDTLFLKVIESAVVGIRKPDPRIYALGVEALNLPADEVVVVGDSYKKDILPARSLGCKTVWFKGEGWTNETFDETIPDKIITHLSQLLVHE